MSCKSEHSGGNILRVYSKNGEIKELIKAVTIEDANKLLTEGYIFLSVYWNTREVREEYILGKLGDEDKVERHVGFLRDK